MAQKQFKIGLSNVDKQNMAQDVYERLLALTFPEYDASTQYNVGDFVVYNDQLYKCISATSGAWDSSKWQLATLNDLVADIEGAVAFVNDKANVDGNYPTMTVGVADNLSPYDEEAGIKQSAPFNFQASGTNNGANPLATVGELALLKEKRGNSVVVNQLYENYNFAANDKYSIPESAYLSGSVANNKLTLIVLQSFISGVDVVFRLGKTTIEGHKYLFFANAKSVVGNNTIRMANYTKTFYKDTLVNQGETKMCFVVGQETAADVIATLRIQGQTNSGNELEVSLYCAIDLTQWFNGDIPQDLLDNPEHFFRYYQGSLAYNEGTLVNANGRYIKCIGRNQFDGTNNVKVVPNSTYYIYGSATLTYKDKDGNTISSESKSNETFDVPANCLSVGVSGSGNICISLYYEDESGYDQYYPYEVLTNTDTGTETLRSAGSVKDYKTPDGTIHRLVGVVDLGTLDWVKDGNHFRSYLKLDTVKTPEDNYSIANIICSKYSKGAFQYIYNETNDKTIGIQAKPAGSEKYIGIYDTTYSSSDAVAFKSAMSGVYLFYELAEETTEQGTPFSENVEIDDFGSMSFEGTNGVPQGALIFYPVDYKAYLDTLHKYTDCDPDNLALKSDLAVVNEKIGAKIPECPTTTDGTYVLKATVSNGSVVYAWVLEE